MAPVVLFLCLFAAAVQSAPAGQHVAAFAPAVYGAPPSPIATVITPIKSQHHAQDGLGQYSYGYASPGQHKEEVRGADGTVVGNYGYVGPDGLHRQVNYVADDSGFRAANAEVPVAPAAEVHTSPVGEVHFPAVAPAPAVTYNTAPVAVAEPAVYAVPAVAAPAVHAVAPALSIAVSGAQAHASEVHQTQVTTRVEPAVYAVPAPAPAVVQPGIYAAPAVAAAPTLTVSVPAAEAHASEVHQSHITTRVEPAVYALSAPTHAVAPLAVQPAVYAAPAVAAAPTLTVSVPAAEAHASEVHQTHITTRVEPAVYSVPAPAPVVAVAAPAPAPAVYAAPVAVAAPAVSYAAVSGAEAHASEVKQTLITSVIQPAIYAVSAPVAAVPTYKFVGQPLVYIKHGHKFHH